MLQLPIVWGLAEPHVALRPWETGAHRPQSEGLFDLGHTAQRLLDLLLCTVGGILIAPILAVVELLIYAQDRGPIALYNPAPVRAGGPFPTTLLWWWTQRPGAACKAQTRVTVPFQTENDPRITAGSRLRKTSIDGCRRI